MAGELVKNKAQVSLEMGLALVGVFLLLVAVINVFTWVNKRLITRQQDYEKTRVRAGSSNTEVKVDESAYPKLDILKTD